jgi:hypothetical protein
MGLISRLLNKVAPKQQNAASNNALVGRPMVSYNYPYGFIDRQITPEVIADDRQVPVVLSSLIGLSRVCFNGFDWDLQPLTEGDDTQSSKIDAALQQIKLIDKKIGKIGRSKNVGTLGLVRAAALEGWTWNKAIFEFKMVKDGSWINPQEIQCLPGQSFYQIPSSLAGQVDRFIPDPILPGIVFDTQDDVTRFFQFQKMGAESIEIDNNNILLIEDSTMPEGTSMMKALVPLIEQWKEIRKYGMLAEKRVSVPTETAQINVDDLAKAAEAQIGINLEDLKVYATSLVEGQGYEQAKVTIPGIRLAYEQPTMPLNPWEADKDLRNQIMDFFFHKDILAVTAQAISATNAPAKDLLDQHIASEREIAGRPFEQFWNNWLSLNGFDLTLELNWWNWAPFDQQIAYTNALSTFAKGGCTINEFRSLSNQDLKDLDDAELTVLIDEHLKLLGLSHSQIL